MPMIKITDEITRMFVSEIVVNMGIRPFISGKVVSATPATPINART